MSEKGLASLPQEELFSQLSTTATGLTAEVAMQRVKTQAAFFKKSSRFKSEVKLFIRQFTSPLVLLLVIAVVLAMVLGESSDSLIILVILVLTGLFGFIQEAGAGRAMEKLRSIIETKHTVVRDGVPVTVNSDQVVPGDILHLDAGDIIPADCRLIDANELHVNESSLTGESFPAEKMVGQLDDNLPLSKKTNCLWQGTSVVSGTASALVVSTGNRTILGRMARSLEHVQETAYEKGLKRFGYFLLTITVVLSMIILCVNVYFKKPLFDSMLFSLALAVGMTPELLPAIMTFAMSAAAKRMSKKKVIVKKLSSIFSFGEITILCTDKTGTITEGDVVVKDIVDASGNGSDRLRLYACLNAVLQSGFSNPIDRAIAALRTGAHSYTKINEVPYDFSRRRLSVAVENGTERFFVTKGAFASVADVCKDLLMPDGNLLPLTDESRENLHSRFIDWSGKGYRVLGLAYKKFTGEKISRADEIDMVFLGYILLEDPLKTTAAASVERLRQQHIAVKIITGDNRYAAMHAAMQVGIKLPVVLAGDEISQLLPEALVIRAKEVDVFAEIEPYQKEQIIKALQKARETVAYIGDGINDVAAIHAADIGISANNAVDVAKEAADLVILEKDLSVLADGVLEGRRSFANSMKYILINTGAIFGNMFSVAGASLVLPFLPMLPKQLLLTNLLSDLPYLTIASDRVDDSQLIQPGKWDLKTLRRFMIVFGLHSSVFDFITFYMLFMYFRLSGPSFQTGWFLESVISELLFLFVVRSRAPLFKSKPAFIVVATSCLACAVTAFLPVSPFAGLLGFASLAFGVSATILAILIAYVVTADLLKIIFWMVIRKRSKWETPSL